jgi:DNA (cytosine-5)-methyltransferase 1
MPPVARMHYVPVGRLSQVLGFAPNHIPVIRKGRVVATAPRRGTAVELFAGVGGFRLALRDTRWRVLWANQWEPSTKRQPAFDCYTAHFRSGEHVNEDIVKVLQDVRAGVRDIPGHDLLVGGFPCQDYSVAKALGLARGLEGDKGNLWWAIHGILELKRPSLVLLENVDRLLGSPAGARGRDFAVILTSLAELGYRVDWRVVNAADYGFPQRRRRVFLLAFHPDAFAWGPDSPFDWILQSGPLARALPAVAQMGPLDGGLSPTYNLAEILRRSKQAGALTVTPFRNAGHVAGADVWTTDLTPRYSGKRRTLRAVLEPEESVPLEYFIQSKDLPAWRYLKGKKNEVRTSRSGHRYIYSEGSIPFPDDLDSPSRTILTCEGGSSASRFRHVIRTDTGRYRKLLPVELERLNGFPDGWTATGMSDSRRAFMMGNALVVGLVRRVTRQLASAFLDRGGVRTAA